MTNPAFENAGFALWFICKEMMVEKSQRTVLFQGCQILSSASAISAGLSATLTPHLARNAFLLAASPLPPEMIAPACPIRLPAGAGAPAVKAATGLVI